MLSAVFTADSMSAVDRMSTLQRPNRQAKSLPLPVLIATGALSRKSFRVST